MSQLIKKAIYILFMFITGLFIISSFFIRAKYNTFLYGDIPVLEKQMPGIFILLIVLLILLSILLYRLSLRLNKFSRKAVITVTLLVSSALQLLIVFIFPKLPAADSQTVLSLALNMLYNHDYSSFKPGGYLYMFPFNFSIVLYLKTLFYLLPDNYVVLKIFNILFSLETTVMIYFIYQELNPNANENDYGVLILAATYIPMLFMSNFVYNDIPATAFLTTAIYFFLKFVKGKSVRHLLIASILLSAGNYFRSIGTLVFIAAIIYLLLNIRIVGLKKVVLSICLMALIFNIPGWTQNTILQAAHIVNEPVDKNSAPVYLWLNMGMNMDTLGYWDNMQSYNIYQRQAGYNKEKSTVLFKEAIKKKLAAASFGEWAKMYYQKLLWTWTEGTYMLETNCIGNEESAQVGRRRGMAQRAYSYTTLATALFQGDSVYRNGLLTILYVQNFLLYCFIFIRLLNGLKNKRFDEVFLILVILGFIGFYLLWEIKSRYTYPVYPLLLVLAYLGYKDAYDFIFARNGRCGRPLRKG